MREDLVERFQELDGFAEGAQVIQNGKVLQQKDDGIHRKRRITAMLTESDLWKLPIKLFEQFLNDSGLIDLKYNGYCRYLREAWHTYQGPRLPEDVCTYGCGQLAEFRGRINGMHLSAAGVRFLEDERERYMNRIQQQRSRQRRRRQKSMPTKVDTPPAHSRIRTEFLHSMGYVPSPDQAHEVASMKLSDPSTVGRETIETNLQKHVRGKDDPQNIQRQLSKVGTRPFKPEKTSSEIKGKFGCNANVPEHSIYDLSGMGMAQQQMTTSGGLWVQDAYQGMVQQPKHTATSFSSQTHLSQLVPAFVIPREYIEQHQPQHQEYQQQQFQHQQYQQNNQQQILLIQPMEGQQDLDRIERNQIHKESPGALVKKYSSIEPQTKRNYGINNVSEQKQDSISQERYHGWQHQSHGQNIQHLENQSQPMLIGETKSEVNTPKSSTQRVVPIHFKNSEGIPKSFSQLDSSITQSETNDITSDVAKENLIVLPTQTTAPATSIFLPVVAESSGTSTIIATQREDSRYSQSAEKSNIMKTATISVQQQSVETPVSCSHHETLTSHSHFMNSSLGPFLYVIQPEVASQLGITAQSESISRASSETPLVISNIGNQKRPNAAQANASFIGSQLPVCIPMSPSRTDKRGAACVGPETHTWHFGAADSTVTPQRRNAFSATVQSPEDLSFLNQQGIITGGNSNMMSTLATYPQSPYKPMISSFPLSPLSHLHGSPSFHDNELQARMGKPVLTQGCRGLADWMSSSQVRSQLVLPRSSVPGKDELSAATAMESLSDCSQLMNLGSHALHVTETNASSLTQARLDNQQHQQQKSHESSKKQNLEERVDSGMQNRDKRLRQHSPNDSGLEVSRTYPDCDSPTKQ